MLLFYGSYLGHSQTEITKWTFEPNLINPNSPLPDFGAGVATLVGGNFANIMHRTGMSATGTGCGTQNGANPGAWALEDLNLGANESNGVQFLCSTVGFTNISISWDQRWSNTAPNTLRLQYTLNGTTWQNFVMSPANTSFCLGVLLADGRFETNTQGDRYRRFIVNFSDIPGAAENPNFGFRVLASHYQSTGEYRRNVDPTQVYSTASTWRFDNVRFVGEPNLPQIFTGATPALSFCQGEVFDLPFSISGSFALGNVFTAQLSDPNGSFTNPTDIGSLNGVNAGVISVQIPVGATLGNAYRIRVVSDNPSVIGTDNGVDFSIQPNVNIGVISGPLTACEGATINYTTSGSSGGQWTVTNTNVANINPITGELSALAPGSTQITYTLTSGCGAPQSADLSLIVNPTFSNNITQQICQGQTFTLGSQVLSSSGIFTVLFQSITGCDSLVTVDLSVVNSIFNTLYETICQGQIFTFGNQQITSSGTYTQTFQSSAGCDSVVTLNLTVNPSFNTTINQSICQGSSISFAGFTITQAGTYSIPLQTSAGCDSTITLVVTEYPPYNQSITQSICQGQSFNFGSQTLTTSGVYTSTFQSINGCDSIVTINLTVNPNFNTTISQTLCQGQSINIGGNVFSQAGNFILSLQSQSGCDSVISLNITVLNPINTNITQQICQGQSINFGNQVLNTSGVYTSTFTSSTSCDSVVTLNLFVNNNFNSTITQNICQGQSFFFNGQNLTQPGTYIATNTSQAGCDSSITLILTVGDLQITLIADGETEFCQGEFVILFPTLSGGFFYQWYRNGISIPGQNNSSYIATQSGIYTVEVVNFAGCQGLSNPIEVEVFPYSPAPTITQSNDTLFSSAPVGNQWYRNGNTLIGQTNNFLKPIQNGVYTVQVTSGNCPSEISQPFNYSKVSVEEFKANSGFVLFPNPSRGEFNLRFNLDIQNQNTIVNVFDLNGRKIIERKEMLNHGQNMLNINLGNVSPGIYFVAFIIEDYIVAEKILITR